jgi:DHA1 family tetracycline resistance protein-like MFS transporter
MTVAHMPAGYLADRFGRRPVLHAAWIMGTLSTWIMALSGSLSVFVVGSALYGMTSFVIAPLNSYVTAARGHWSVGRAITLITAIFSIGSILGPLLGGWVGEQMGLRRTFLVAACIFMVSTLIILFIRPQPVEARSHEVTSNSLGKILNRRYVLFLTVVFIAMFSMFLPQPLSQNFLQNERGINLAQIGQLLSARGVGVVVLNLVLGQLSARTGFLLAQVGMACFTLLIWGGQGLPWYLVGYALVGSYQTARSLATAQGRALLDAANMGLGYGMIETVMSSAMILAPPLAGWLYAQNPPWIYSVSLGFIIVALIISLFFLPLHTADPDMAK